jgi:hypothetical protein
MSQISKYEITKGLVREQGNLNNLQDVTAEISRRDNVPDLITFMLSPEQVFLQTKNFQHDVTVRKNTMPSDKPYAERGQVIDARPVTDTHLLSVPSFGLQGHVRPSDVLRRRKPGTVDMLLAKQDVVNEEKASLMRAWDLYREKSLSHSIVTGTSYVPNATIPSVNFFTEYTGAARPVVTYTLSSTTVHPKVYGEEVRRRIADNLNDGETVNGYVVLCGKTFWAQLTNHPLWIQAMVDRTGLEGQDPLIKRFENFREQYQMFRGADNNLYVEYAGQIGGTPLIPDGEAYAIPLGVNLFTEYFAPAETESYVNTVANAEYMWEVSSEFDGTKIFTESNRLVVPHNPLLIQKCVLA